MNAGVIYTITNGDKRVDLSAEFKKSVESVKRHMPDIPITLFTDYKGIESILNDDTIMNNISVTEIELPRLGFADKITSMIHTPYEYTLYVDTDTYFCDSILEVFPMLDRFNLAACATPLRAGKYKNVPECFQMLNAGIIFFKKTLDVSSFLVDWFTSYTSELLIDSKCTDQIVMRKMLYDSGLKFVILPPEYNYRFPFKYTAHGKVKILHGRYHDLTSLDAMINQSSKLRRFDINNLSVD